MSAIAEIKSLFTGRFSDGQKKLSVYIDDKNVTELNCIRIFYTNINSWVSVTQTKSPYYRLGMQVVIRHNDYDKSRSVCHDVLEWLNANRKTKNGYYWIPEGVPSYLGVDNIGGYVWAFNLSTKGGA
jgi:hypothetical protein